MLMLRRRGVVVAQFFSISTDFLRSQNLYSTASSSSSSSSTTKKPHLFIDYLVDSLGFSRQAAISSSSKLKVNPYLKSPKNADLVVNIFKDYGLDNTQIKDIISSEPQILRIKAKKTLEPKLKVFRELGLSGTNLVEFIRIDPALLRSTLSTNVIPTINFLRKILGNDEDVIKAIRRTKWLFRLSIMPANVLLLQRYNISNEKIKQTLLKYPGIFQVSSELLEERINYVEQELGISRDHPTFVLGLGVSVYFSRSTIEEKMQVFKSFGWSESELSTLVRAQPVCLTYSASTIREKLDFLMNSIHYTPSDLISYSNCFTYSLEKRVKPRFGLLKMLKEKKLVNDKPALSTIFHYSDLQFLKFLRCFESVVPGLCEGYMSSTRTMSKTE